MTIICVYAKDLYDNAIAGTAEIFDGDQHDEAEAYKVQLQRQGYKRVAVETDKI